MSKRHKAQFSVSSVFLLLTVGSYYERLITKSCIKQTTQPFYKYAKNSTNMEKIQKSKKYILIVQRST